MPDDSPQTYRPKPPKGYTLFHVVEAVPKTRVMKRYMSHWMPAYIYHHLWRKPYQSPPPNQACHKVRHREYGGKTNTFLQYYTNSNAFA